MITTAAVGGPSQREGARITGVWLGALGDDSHPIPNAASASLTGTAGSFMVGGGDGSTVLEVVRIVQQPEAELPPLLEYVAAPPTPFRYAADGRIATR